MSAKFPFLIPSYHAVAPRVESTKRFSTPVEQDRINNVLTPTRISVSPINKSPSEIMKITTPKEIPKVPFLSKTFPKKNLIIASLTASVGIFVIVSGISLGLLLAPKPTEADYGQSCTEKSCMQSKMLSCINQTCLCDPAEEYYSNGKCEEQSLANRNYGESCKVGYTICSGLSVCISSICQCNSNTHYWDGSNCVSKKTHNQICSLQSSAFCVSSQDCIECSISQGLECDSNTKQCVCSNQTYFYFDTGLTQCEPVKGYTQACSTIIKCDSTKQLICQTTTSASLAAHCPSTSVLNMCDCPNGYYYNTIKDKCDIKKTYWINCNSNCECNNVVTGLTCLNNMCVCGQGFYFDTTTKTCQAQKTYPQACTSNNECQNTVGLSCVSGICDCSPSNRYYWNSANSKCIECPHGWTLVEISAGFKRCYFTSPDALVLASWDQSRARCISLSADLVVFDDRTEYYAFRNAIFVWRWLFIGMTGDCINGFNYINGVSGYMLGAGGASVNTRPFPWHNGGCDNSLSSSRMMVHFAFLTGVNVCNTCSGQFVCELNL
jgi:hypothetical protein